GGGRQKIPYEPSAQWGLSGYHFAHALNFNYSYEIPLGQGLGGLAGILLSGWRTSGVVNMRTGQPQNPTQSISNPQRDLAVNPRSPNVNPNFHGEVVLSGGRDPNAYINLDAYLPSGTFEFGNLGRNTLIGPGSMTWNPAIAKRSSLTESVSLEFRTEFFNVLNRANFGPPANNLFNASGAKVGNAGTINSTSNTSRQVQFALKLLW
ncbi:MAG TPA: carboxypeptidase regulatory-like domain-containing protein, partial [Terriglobia bacterium]|nr:carboxypeptidase regulatory-like domain-containing protein [Terriglobia bacterium]